MKARKPKRWVLFLLAGLIVIAMVGASPIVTSYVASMPPLFQDPCTDAVEKLGLPAEEVSFPADDGLILRGWFFPTANPDAPAIIYVHGSGASPQEGLPLVTPLHDAGYQVLLFSYRNHGPSDKNWIEGISFGARESRDVDAAIRYVRDTLGITRFALQGFSMGAESVLLSAARNPDVLGVAAESAYASFDQAWAANGRPVPGAFISITRTLVSWMRNFRARDVQPIEVVDQIAPRPLLLIHGTSDIAIPWNQSQLLYDAAQEPKELWLVDGAGHGNIRKLYPYTYTSLLLRFYARVFDQVPVLPPH